MATKMNLKEVAGGRQGVLSVQWSKFLCEMNKGEANAQAKSTMLQKERGGAPARPPWSANTELPLDAGPTNTHDEELALQLRTAQEKAQILQRQYNAKLANQKRQVSIQKDYRPTAVWMDNYRGPEGGKAAQKQVNLSAQGGAGYNIISGGDSIGRVKTPRVPTGRIGTGRLPSARPRSGEISGDQLAHHLGEDLRKIQYEQYIGDPSVQESLTQMLQRIKQLDEDQQ